MNINIFQFLTNIYGINKYKANKIIINLGLNHNTNYNNIPKNKIIRLNKIILYLKNIKSINIPLKNFIKNNIKNKIKLNTIAGNRHKLKYPVRGQRTRTNARTAKKSTHLR